MIDHFIGRSIQNRRYNLVKKVLFICMGNTCRSQMAKGFFNTFTSSECADSAGIKPESQIDPHTIQVMDEVGIDVRSFIPKKLTVEMNNNFDIFVMMAHCTDRLTISREKTFRWSIEDPKGKSLDDYRIVRDKIKNHVETLLASMKKKQKEYDCG